MPSFAQQILEEIAKDLGKPIDTVKKFIDVLEENWYDTRESLEQLDEQTMQSLNIPLRIGKMIKEKVDNKMPTNNIVQTQDSGVNELAEKLRDFKMHTISGEKYINGLNLINLMIQNILKNPSEEKFRKIKISNVKFQTCVGQFNDAGYQLMYQIGFEVDGEELCLKQPNLDKLKHISNKIQSTIDSTPTDFNPYQQYSSSLTGGQVSDLAKKMGVETFSFHDKLQQLKQQRDSMIKPIHDRELIFLQIDPVKNINQQMQSFDQDLNESSQENNQVLKKAIMNLALELEQQTQFSSRSKKEYQDLLNRPFFAETLIRIKLPNQILIQAKFSPKETIGNVLQLLKEVLDSQISDFHIYQSPPIQIMTSKFFNQTLEDMNCVPSGLFYLQVNNQNNQTDHIQDKHESKTNFSLGSSQNINQPFIKQQFINNIQII